eukprot:scaffold3263_cov93-Cylindrotheca_fusiformis.AAC.2
MSYKHLNHAQNLCGQGKPSNRNMSFHEAPSSMKSPSQCHLITRTRYKTELRSSIKRHVEGPFQLNSRIGSI